MLPNYQKKPSTSSLESEDLPAEYAAILAKFQAPEASAVKGEDGDGDDAETGKGKVYYSDDEALSEEDEAAAAAAAELSKRKQKKLNRLSVAELKRLVKRPDVVDWVDVSALDPRLLVHLKSYRNSIPIPPHWSAKRDYLAGKKGIEKPPFQLPSFIADTGIATQRDAVKEKEEGQSLKQKTRERVQPKMGKIDIDYQKLHDAFFKFQTKPPMSDFGELYYEGKEFETHLKEKKPGDLSKDLKEALSIPPLAPPPWLIAMQRFGPPPSYPNLRIPGLNAPIPEGAQWGFHPGGWGKPPVDEFNRPLYGDVFGVALTTEQQEDQYVDKTLWGELEPDLEESEDEEEDEEEEMDEDSAAVPAGGMETPSSFAQGMETPSGFQSVASTVPGGLETPDFLELRKRRDTTVDSDAGGGAPRSLYQVIPEHQTGIKGFLGSDRAYDTRNIGTGNVPILGVDDRGQKRKAAQQNASGVDVSIDAADLEGMSEQELRQKFEAARRSGQAGGAGQGGREDFSDFVAEEAAKRRKMQGEQVFNFREPSKTAASADTVSTLTIFDRPTQRTEKGQLQVLSLKIVSRVPVSSARLELLCPAESAIQQYCRLLHPPGNGICYTALDSMPTLRMRSQSCAKARNVRSAANSKYWPDQATLASRLDPIRVLPHETDMCSHCPDSFSRASGPYLGMVSGRGGTSMRCRERLSEAEMLHTQVQLRTVLYFVSSLASRFVSLLSIATPSIPTSISSNERDRHLQLPISSTRVRLPLIGMQLHLVGSAPGRSPRTILPVSRSFPVPASVHGRYDLTVQ